MCDFEKPYLPQESIFFNFMCHNSILRAQESNKNYLFKLKILKK